MLDQYFLEFDYLLFNGKCCYCKDFLMFDF